MKKQFYHYLISFKELDIELENIEASPEEKKHLKALAEENLHIALLDGVLSELEEEDKKTFLKHIHHDEHEKIWELLQAKTNGVEEKIISIANAMIEEFKKDIHEIKNSS